MKQQHDGTVASQSELRQRHTPCSTQWEMCLVVNRSASNTRPTPMAFLRMDVVYTGVRSVFCWGAERHHNHKTADLLLTKCSAILNMK